MQIAVNRRFKLVAALLLVSIIVAGASFAALAEWRRGPFFCGNCQLRNPMPDPATRAAIDNNLAPIDRVVAPPLGPSVVMIICNARSCVDYRQTVSGRWEGSNARPMQNGTGGGGGGGSGGGGGGYGGGGGCVASCGGGPGGGSGSVTVGKEEKLPPKQQN